jgi:uncharacterized membrane protein
MMQQTQSVKRLAYIDWMRGLACVLMFQTHCYDAWLGGSARKSSFIVWSQLLGTLPAPLFLFLAGVSVALVVAKSYTAGKPIEQVPRVILRRGGEILLLGLLFRLQEFVIAWGWAPWTDLLRVDVLNTIGMSIILLGAGCWVAVAARAKAWKIPMFAMAAVCACAISFLTPLVWTTWRPGWLPWPIESYIDGVHNLGQPQASLFPIFPWAGFAFVGLAAGLILTSDWARRHGALLWAYAGAVAVVLIFAARWIERQGWHFYRAHDYWHTSPDFFLLRVGLLLGVLAVAQAWCRWGVAAWGFSPLVQLGQTSLLVYWVHLEFVYGRFSLLPKRSNGIQTASLGLVAICVAMWALSLVRTRFKARSIVMRRTGGDPFGFAQGRSAPAPHEH